MRRSPLVTALLVLYPIAIAVLIGFALSGGPDKPRVAFLNEVPADTPLQIGGTDFDLAGAKSELCSGSNASRSPARRRRGNWSNPATCSAR